MKNTCLLLVCMIFFEIARAQLSWYVVEQKGVGNLDINGKASVNKWTESHATISIDMQNSNIYIYDSGKSEHFNVTGRINKVKSAQSYTKVYAAKNENGIACKIGLCDNKENKKKAELSVYLPDNSVFIYRITKRILNQPG